MVGLQIERSRFKPGPGSLCCVPGKTLYSHSASLHPGVNGYPQTVMETWQNVGRYL